MSAPLTEHLDAAGLFSGLAPDAKARIAERFTTRRVARGDVIMRQGDPADSLYVVVSGRFAVTVAGRLSPVTEIGPGQPIGEIGFLTGRPRTATVSAMRDGLVLRLSRQELDDLATGHPEVWRAMSITLAERLAETTAASPPPPDPRPRTVAVIRAGGSPLPPVVTDRIAEAFLRAAPTLVVTPANRIEILGATATDEDCDETTHKLNALESRYDYVLFLADDERTPWSEKVIRHADLVLAVGLFSANPALSPLETLADRYLAPDARRLVLVHTARGRVSSTERWLEGRAVAMHHHAALDTRGDFDRVVRFISGTARGFVAAGGGALCAAHVGAYKALVEAGVEFDIMGGTSGGSAMAAAFMLRSTPDEIDEAVHEMFVARKALRRYTLPRYSLIDHARFDAELKRLYGLAGIEDLWLPFFAVSTNLSRNALHLHRRGSLWGAVRASASIPVLLPPVYTVDGEMLVDGGLLDNVPIRAMHELKSGPNVVVSFETTSVERFEVSYDALPGRSQILRLIANPLARSTWPKAPGVVSVLMRSLMANRQSFHRHLAPGDALLVPPIPKGIGLLDWHRHRELFEATYEWTRKALAENPGLQPQS